MKNSGNQQPFGIVKLIDLPEGKLKVISVDFITPLPKTKSGNSAILTEVFHLPQMCLLIPITIDVPAP